jgi:hypothetical protein
MGEKNRGDTNDRSGSEPSPSLKELAIFLRQFTHELETHTAMPSEGDDPAEWGELRSDVKRLKILVEDKCELIENNFDRVLVQVRNRLNFDKLEKKAKVRFSEQQKNNIGIIANYLSWYGHNDPILSAEKGNRTERLKSGANLKGLAKHAMEVHESIANLLEQMGGRYGPIARMFFEINKLPPPFDILNTEMISPVVGFGRYINDLGKALQSLSAIEKFAIEASKKVIGKGEAKAPKAYAQFKALMKNLNTLYQEAGGEGKGIHTDPYSETYTGPFLDLAYELLCQIRSRLGPSPASFIPNFSSGEPNEQEKNSIGRYIYKQILAPNKTRKTNSK